MDLRQYDKRKVQTGGISVLLLALCAFLFAGCESDDLPEKEPQVSDIVEISATIGSTATRVTQTSDNVYTFEKGDQVHVVGWYGGDWSDFPKPWEGSETWWNDSKSLFNGTKWVCTPYMRWANLSDEDICHHFLAWWPEDLATGTDDLTAVTYERDKVTEHDILVAHKTTPATPGTPIQLQFDHLMARFDIRITEFKSQLEGMTDLTVTIPDLQVDATINLLEKTVTPVGTKQTVSLGKQSEDMTWHSGILVPQSFSGLCLTVSYSDGMTETLQCNYEIVLKSGSRTTLRLIAGRDKVEVETVEVTAWEISPEIDAGEAEETEQ